MEPAVPQHVLDAFGAPGVAVRLAGGEERTYRAGGIVLRRENPGEIADAEFAADLFGGIEESRDFRLPRPLRTPQGTWLTRDGWTGWTFVEGGAAGPADAPAMVRAIEAFHRAIAGVPCPAYLCSRALLYDRADRGAFGDLPPDVDARARPVIEELCALRRPLTGLTDQLIHGDANAANVLIAPGLPPAIIDLAPYWRPPEFALAVTALWLCAYHGHVEAFAAFEHVRHFNQLLLRALIRTLLVMDAFRGAEHLAEYQPSIDIVRRRLTR
jgi:hypothetical protein